MWGVCVAGQGGTKENKLLVSSRKDQRRNLKTSVVFHSTCDASVEHVGLACMLPPSNAWVCVFFQRLEVVTPFQRRFEGNCVKFHRHATTPAHFERPGMCTSRFSEFVQKRIFCSPQGAEDIWHLRSHVNFSLYLFLLGYVIVETCMRWSCRCLFN